MTCEASVGVSVKTVTVLSRTIFYGAGDRLAQKISSCVELEDYVETCNVVWGVLACSSIFVTSLVCKKVSGLR